MNKKSKSESARTTADAQPGRAHVAHSQTVFGTDIVRYSCFSCDEPLRSRATEAGIVDHCPVCLVQFIVPGRHVLKQLEKSKLIKRREEKERARSKYVRVERNLELLEHQLEIDARLEESKSRLETENELKRNNLKQLEVSSESRIRRTASMEQAIVVFTQMTADAIEQIQQKDWPPHLIAETRERILKLRKRTNEAILANDEDEK
jgi:hypothetical protein